ncbi:MAG TPA: alpha/beta hydrolase [Candidatus Elarobacter sp.]|jgi:pimeloyl-ACP methyl ester carboxylesterase|nr:alpha/beta hydrolase [Candidatus Elarobacter sp.]
MTVLSRRVFLAGAAAGSALWSLTGPAVAQARSVDESGFVRIGGIDQWIAMQGEDERNPVLLFLHGGPAEAESPFLREFAPWERSFTVVNWDQRGSGKTYGKNGPATPDMTVERMAQDAVEVAEHARRTRRKPKVVLVGHSWGAALGLYAVTLRPDLFYAFVGTGQPVSWALSIEDRERWARKQAAAEHDAAAITTLDETASLPVSDMKRVNASGKWRMSASDKQYLQIQREFMGAPPFPTKGDVADWIAGGDFTGPKLWPTIVNFDARKQFPEIPVPFFVIEGRDDHVGSFEAAKDYVEQVRAPKKAFIPIDGGHFACFTDPAEFLAAVRTSVMPYVRGESA